MLVHHANKTGEDFRGSSKLAARFETIIKLERIGSTIEHGAAAFRVQWDKVNCTVFEAKQTSSDGQRPLVGSD
jgi:hypothetical protein